MIGNHAETTAVAEVADFSASQRQQEKAETSRKKGCRGCVASVRGLAEKSRHPTSPRDGFPSAPRGGTYFGAEMVLARTIWVKRCWYLAPELRGRSCNSDIMCMLSPGFTP